MNRSILYVTNGCRWVLSAALIYAISQSAAWPVTLAVTLLCLRLEVDEYLILKSNRLFEHWGGEFVEHVAIVNRYMNTITAILETQTESPRRMYLSAWLTALKGEKTH